MAPMLRSPHKYTLQQTKYDRERLRKRTRKAQEGDATGSSGAGTSGTSGARAGSSPVHPGRLPAPDLYALYRELLECAADAELPPGTQVWVKVVGVGAPLRCQLVAADGGAHVLWRFVIRAIDEVERGSVPAVVLVARASTDTAWLQRLRPYPRVMLRRTSAQFKDYDKTPIGFGIAVFCLAGAGMRDQLYPRFIDAFEAWGEPSIPIDRAFMVSLEFKLLLARLCAHAKEFHRDNWVECGACGKWRILPYDEYRGLGGNDWTCAQLRGRGGAASGCNTPQLPAEARGVRYAVGAAARSEERNLLGLGSWEQPPREEPREPAGPGICQHQPRQGGPHGAGAEAAGGAELGTCQQQPPRQGGPHGAGADAAGGAELGTCQQQPRQGGPHGAGADAAGGAELGTCQQQPPRQGGL
ncbi:hypothetical protein TSOC_011031 [Tetrabaena socialis]|uniref:CW-type domain-containing protein n=1 Tax=Tetrabaena socialis TaxID=47790 RepID=A0A2J7ZRQ5_9CHLO|nr:hypothetical protein TSOC_011031 [Tetrabaena socialis]|eukprot:PNH02949.1 hypothetical protein TSOC_011031 [Tetrabaena socialis]